MFFSVQEKTVQDQALWCSHQQENWLYKLSRKSRNTPIVA